MLSKIRKIIAYLILAIMALFIFLSWGSALGILLTLFIGFSILVVFGVFMIILEKIFS